MELTAIELQTLPVQKDTIKQQQAFILHGSQKDTIDKKNIKKYLELEENGADPRSRGIQQGHWCLRDGDLADDAGPGAQVSVGAPAAPIDQSWIGRSIWAFACQSKIGRSALRKVEMSTRPLNRGNLTSYCT